LKLSTNTQRYKDNYFALKMKSSEVAHDGGERTHAQNNNKTKLDQLNLNKTYPSKWLRTTDF
jgi:hypothetical protein